MMLSNLCITLQNYSYPAKKLQKINIYSSSGFKFDIRRKLYTNWLGGEIIRSTIMLIEIHILMNYVLDKLNR